jgi:hypothetical protein
VASAASSAARSWPKYSRWSAKIGRPADRDRAGGVLLTVLVDDLDATIDDLAGRSITVEPAEPDGNTITHEAPAS